MDPLGPGIGIGSRHRLVACSVCLLTFGSGEARGQDGGDALAVEIADLPPLPAAEGDDDSLIGVAVEGAAQVEEFVVVGASKREQSLGTVASAVTVIPQEDLRRFGYRTVAEALRGVVGLYIVDDRQIERLGIRGVQPLGDANTRILVLVDGSTINEPWSQYADTSYALPVHIDDVARIEVIRGPVSSIYGTNAFLGIINIVTVEADKAPRAYGRVTAGSLETVSGNVAFGSGGVNRQVRGFAAWTSHAGETLTFGEAFEMDGAGATTEADGLLSLAGGVSVHFDRLFVQARASRRARELPGAPFDSAEGSDGNENTDRLVLSELGYTQDVGDRVSVATRIYVNHYQLEQSLDLELEGEPVGTQPYRSVASSLWYGGEARALVQVLDGGKLDLTAGAAGELADTHSESLLVNDPGNVVAIDESFNIAGAYAEVSGQPLPWLAFTGGVRFDRHSLFENRLSPRGALFVRKPRRYGLKLLYAEGFRNPSLFEDAYFDDFRFRPSGELRPESIRSTEAVAWVAPRPGIDVRLSGWRWDLEDMIEKRLVIEGNSPRFQFQNLSTARSQGVEVEASYRDTRGWLARASATYAQVEFNDGPAVNAPELAAAAGVSTPRIAGLAHLSVEATYVHERLTRDEDVVADPWLGLNATLYVPDYRGFDFTLCMRNILGDREQVPAQAEYDRVFISGTGRPERADVLLIPGAGRELFARVGYRY